MAPESKIEIPVYYDEEKEQWFVDENYEDLVKDFNMLVGAMNKKYCSVRDGSHSYAFGWLDKSLVDKIENKYPGVFEPDGDYFDIAIDSDTLASVWNLEDFYKEVVTINYQNDVDGSTFEDFKKSIGVEE